MRCIGHNWPMGFGGDQMDPEPMGSDAATPPQQFRTSPLFGSAAPRRVHLLRRMTQWLRLSAPSAASIFPGEGMFYPAVLRFTLTNYRSCSIV